MKRITSLFLIFALCLPFTVSAQQPGSRLSRVAGVFTASSYGQWQAKISLGSSSTGAVTYTLASGQVQLPDGRVIVPFAITAPLLIGSGANQETATPSAVSGCTLNAQPNTCQITITVSNAHGQGDIIQSGTAGLQEAINDASAAGGGQVVVDRAWTALGGTSTMITSTATAKTSVGVTDQRGTGPVFYGKTSTSYVAVLSLGATVPTLPSGSIITAPVITTGLTASGSAANDFSASTGTFKTSTGAGTFGGSSNTFTGTSPQLDLGVSGSVVGAVKLENATSGSITVAPPTGALGTVTSTVPAITGGLVAGFSCGATGTGSQTCSPVAVNGQFHLYNGNSVLSSNAATITFPVAFASTTSFFCVANDITTRANPVQMVPASASTATITNTTGASDTIQWICAGQ